MLLVGLAFLPIIATVWPAIISLVGDGALVIMALIVVISLAGGHLLGGPTEPTAPPWPLPARSAIPASP